MNTDLLYTISFFLPFIWLITSKLIKNEELKRSTRLIIISTYFFSTLLNICNFIHLLNIQESSIIPINLTIKITPICLLILMIKETFSKNKKKEEEKIEECHL